MGKVTNWLKHAWSAFSNKDPTEPYAVGSSFRQDKILTRTTTESSIVNSIFNRIAIDVAQLDIEHVRIDDDGKYLETLKTSLNECLTIQANIDQSGRELIRDVVMSMFDEGVVAIVPVETKIAIKNPGTFDVTKIRVGKITQWYPQSVQIEVYNEHTGRREKIYMKKEFVAIVENPLYSIMNQPNSILKRLVHKINLLDIVDDISGSGKLDIIIQLPYVINSDRRREQADKRRAEIERQMKDSKYGIAYIDGTEHITQLNRASENNLLSQVQYLTNMLYNQLGLTEHVFDGTASPDEMTNYYNRTIEPIITAIVDAMNRTYLSKTARSQNQTIKFFRDPLKLVSVDKIADIADKLTRNEILSSNELRAVIGRKASSDPSADELRNKNINQASEENQNAEVSGDTNFSGDESIKQKIEEMLKQGGNHG